jgi:fucose permease
VPTPLRHNRDFVLLEIGQVLSNLGTELTLIAYPLLILSLTHSPAKAGLVGFARFVPYVLFVIPAGVAVDRANRKRLMILCDIGRALALAWIVIALAGGWLTFAQVLVVAFVEGTLLAFFNLAELGAIGQVVPPARLGEAVAVEQARVFGTTLAGPPLGGALFGLTRALPFLGDAISYALSVVSLAFMRTPFQETRTEPSAHWRTEVAEGFRWLWRSAFLRTCALIFSGTNLAWNAARTTTATPASSTAMSRG